MTVLAGVWFCFVLGAVLYNPIKSCVSFTGKHIYVSFLFLLLFPFLSWIDIYQHFLSIMQQILGSNTVCSFFSPRKNITLNDIRYFALLSPEYSLRPVCTLWLIHYQGCKKKCHVIPYGLCRCPLYYTTLWDWDSLKKGQIFCEPYLNVVIDFRDLEECQIADDCQSLFLGIYPW